MYGLAGGVTEKYYLMESEMAGYILKWEGAFYGIFIHEGTYNDLKALMPESDVILYFCTDT